jgi:hypothetical protein
MTSVSNPIQLLLMRFSGVIPGQAFHLLQAVVFATPYVVILVALLRSESGRRHRACVVGMVLVLLGRGISLLGSLSLLVLGGSGQVPGTVMFYQLGSMIHFAGLLTFAVGLLSLLRNVDVLTALSRFEGDDRTERGAR